MTPKKKTCKSCGKETYIWARGKCKYCDAKERPPKPIKKQPIKWKHEPTGQKEVFEEIWEERPHRCFVSGDPIHEPKPENFAHVLAKGLNKYPKFKLYKKNIQLMLPHLHSLYDHGYEEQRQKSGHAEGWAKLYALRDELIEEYKNLYGKK